MALIGRYEYSLDPKNRLGVPPKYREALAREKGTHFYLTMGLDGCLSLYLPSEWQKLQENSRNLFSHPDKEKQRAFTRKFFSEATEVELDSAGRILIPAQHKTRAGLKTTVLMLGVNNRAEIWDLQKWNSYNKSKVEPTFKEVSKTLDI